MDAAEFKERRKAAKLTQAELGKRLGLHRDHIGLMERGVQPIAERTALAMTRLHPDGASTASQPLTTRDPMERIIERALIDAGIAFTTDQGGKTESALDFHLTDLDISIEVKRFYTSRTGEQMARAPNVIVAQGERAVRFLAAAIQSGDWFEMILGAKLADSVRHRP